MDSRRGVLVQGGVAAAILISLALGVGLLIAGVMDVLGRQGAPLAWAQDQCSYVAADASSSTYEACVQGALGRGVLAPATTELVGGLAALGVAALLIGGVVLAIRHTDQIPLPDWRLLDPVRSSLSSPTS